MVVLLTSMSFIFQFSWFLIVHGLYFLWYLGMVVGCLFVSLTISLKFISCSVWAIVVSFSETEIGGSGGTIFYSDHYFNMIGWFFVYSFGIYTVVATIFGIFWRYSHNYNASCVKFSH